MSAFKNDPRGTKQRVGAVVLICAAWLLLLLNGQGARLKCDDDTCVLARRSILRTGQDTFRWSDVRSAKVTYATTRYTSGGVGRISVDENVVLEIAPGRIVEVLPAADSWIFGSLSGPALTAAIGGPAPESLWLASFGVRTYFIWFILASVGALFTLLSVIRAIRPDMPAEELQAARMYNLKRFLLLGVVFSAFWLLSFAGLLWWYVWS